MLLTSQSVTQKYWVINSLPLLIWEAPTICERQFVTALVLRFSKQTIRSIVPNSAYIWRKTHKVKAWVTPRPSYCKIIHRPKQFTLKRVSFFFFPSFHSQQGVLESARNSATSVGCVCRPHPNMLNYYWWLRQFCSAGEPIKSRQYLQD